MAVPAASRAGNGRAFGQCRAQPLAAHFHEAELADGAELHPGAVLTQRIAPLDIEPQCQRFLRQRQITLGELVGDAPVHVRNKFTSIVDRRPYMLELSGEADAELQAHLGRTMSVDQLTYQMITASSNFATNLLVDVVGVSVIQRAPEDLAGQGYDMLPIL